MYRIVYIRYRFKNNTNDADVLIDFHGYGMYTTYLAAMMKSNKKISWIHEQNIYNEYRWISGVYKKFDHIFGCSQECCNNFIDVFPHLRKKVSVYYNYLDVEEIKKKASSKKHILYGDVGTKFKIVSVGRIVPQKAFDRAIDAAHILNSRKRDFVWFILGDGEQLEELQEIAKRKGIERYIFFLGFRDNPYPYIKNADLYVQTSIAEGYCTTISEAIVLGKAVITTDVGGAREQLENGKGGIVVGHSAIQIADAIDNMMSDKEKLKKMSLYNSEKKMSFISEIQKLYHEIE